VIAGNRDTRRAAAKYLREESAKWPEQLTEVPREQWPQRMHPGLVRVLRSRAYLVQVFHDAGVVARLSVSRTALAPDGGWEADIPWEDLQRLKAEAGYGKHDAVEVFPRAGDEVNVANMRHLWVLAEPLHFVWRDKP
jgi:hypothetical protein